MDSSMASIFAPSPEVEEDLFRFHTVEVFLWEVLPAFLLAFRNIWSVRETFERQSVDDRFRHASIVNTGQLQYP